MTLWCFFQKGLIIQRIKFDELFWKSMIDKLTKFYQQHAMLEAICSSNDIEAQQSSVLSRVFVTQNVIFKVPYFHC